MTPEEKLLRAIFGEKASDVRDTSLRLPPGVSGTIVEVRVFSRRGVDKDERALAIERAEIERLAKDRDDEQAILERNFYQPPEGAAGQPDRRRRPEDAEGRRPRSPRRLLSEIHARPVAPDRVKNDKRMAEIEGLKKQFDEAVNALEKRFENKVEKLQRGDELPPGVMKMVKVFVAVKRKLQPGDKMAGRHGNKGVVSRIMPSEDMPYLEDGTPVDIVLNPLGVPSAHERRADPGDPSGLGLRQSRPPDRRDARRRCSASTKAAELRKQLKDVYGEKIYKADIDGPRATTSWSSWPTTCAGRADRVAGVRRRARGRHRRDAGAGRPADARARCA